MSQIPAIRPRPAIPRHVPISLIYDELDGRPLYRKGYRDVVKAKKTVEDIMGLSVLQTILIAVITRFLNRTLPLTYLVGTGEPGVHLGHGENVSNDILIIEKSRVPAVNLEKYFDMAPTVVFEVDIRIEVADFYTTPMEYVVQKTDKLMAFGVETLIWILSKERKIMVVRPNEPWQLHNWQDTITFMDGYSFSLQHLLDQEGYGNLLD